MSEIVTEGTSQNIDGSLRKVPFACVLDLDDTVIDTGRMFEVFLSVATSYDISPEKLKEARMEARKNGGSLDVADYVIGLIGVGRWESLCAEFAARSKGRDFLLPGAQAALDFLSRNNIAFGFKTYGGAIWQPIKRDVAGIDTAIAFHVVSRKNKGEMMSARYDLESGGFVIDWLNCVATKVVMIDNDPVSFNGLEKYITTGQVLALWVPYSDNDTSKPVSSGVVRVANLNEAMSELVNWLELPNIGVHQ